MDALLAQGYKIVALKRSFSNLERIKHLDGVVDFYDIDRSLLDDVFSQNKISCIIHLACNYGRDGSSINSIVDANVVFGVQLLSLAIKYNISLFVNADTLLNRAVSPYAMSKGHFSDWLRSMSTSIRIINLRMEHMYGPRDDQTKFIPWIIEQLSVSAPTIELTSGMQERDFIYISDVVSAVIMLLKRGDAGVGFFEYQVGTGHSIKLREFVELIKVTYEENCGPTKTKILFGAKPDRVGESMNIQVDVKGLRGLGWSPRIGHKEGLEILMRRREWVI